MNNNQIEIDLNQLRVRIYFDLILYNFVSFKDPSGIFELIEVIENGTNGQVYKVIFLNVRVIVSLKCCLEGSSYYDVVS